MDPDVRRLREVTLHLLDDEPRRGVSDT